jgi:glycosyltransferase involved in cell wall biosynthesis
VRFSVIVPAHNETRFITPCLASIRDAAVRFPGDVETIVVLNRCTDNTQEIAESFEARIVHEDAKIMARVRNAGAKAATGEIIVTIDADSRMSSGALEAIDRALASGKTVGGGAIVYPERWSPGIIATLLVGMILVVVYRVSGGMFWCLRKDFEALNGFNEELVSAEDVDFARRLKQYGARTGKPFSTLRGAHIVTSCRKFDQFGDWHILRNPRLVRDLLRGNNRRAADRYYYDVER